MAERADIDHFFVRHAESSGAFHKEGMVRRAPTGAVAEYGARGTRRHASAFRYGIRPDCGTRQTTEELLAGPQDIEGAITADAAIHLVQARPAAWGRRRRGPLSGRTTTSPKLSGRDQGDDVLARAQFYQMGFRDFYRIVGVPERQRQSREHHLRRMIGHLDGRVYYRLDAWYALHSQIPGSTSFARCGNDHWG